MIGAHAVDLYCERTAPGLWNEPLNAASNLAFLAVAAVLLRPRRGPAAGRPADADLALLAGLIGAIGVASGLFHTLASDWAGRLDSAVIGLYLLAYVAVFAHRVGGLPWRRAWLGAPGFALFIAMVMVAVAALPVAALRGIGMYVAAWLGLWALAGWAVRRGSRAWRALVGAALLFALSLALRQLDLPLCARWPWGTHWAWHGLNALTLWLSVRALGASQAAPRSPAPSG